MVLMPATQAWQPEPCCVLGGGAAASRQLCSAPFEGMCGLSCTGGVCGNFLIKIYLYDF